MPRIPEAEIERLKNEISVQRLVESSGIALKKVGKDLQGCCPFHEDDTASLVVTPAKNLWHCFGCGIGGGPIDWVIKKNGVSFRHAVELLREGISPLAAGPVKHSTVRSLPPPVAPDADDQKLLDDTIAYYHERLKQSPDALAYLDARGLAHPEVVDTFKLGFADRTLGLRLPEKNRKAGADIRARLQKIGLLRESGHEHFNGSLVIPILNEAGQAVEVYGRKLLDNLRAGTPKHLYLPGPHAGIFNLTALQSSKEIILCEALIDALTFWCAGYRNVTSAYGIEGFTDEMLEAFQRHGTQRVLIAFDRDEAGERGAAKVSERLLAAGIECFRIQFPKGMDANSYALKVQPAAKSLGIAIRKAVWLGKGAAPAKPSALASFDIANCDIKEVVAHCDHPAPNLAAPAAEPLPASPVPEALPDAPLDINAKEITLTLGEGSESRRYRVRGLARNLAVDILKINLLVGVGQGEHAAFHVDTLDFYNAKQRHHYIAEASRETGLDERILKSDLARLLVALEGVQDQTIEAALQPEPPAQMSQPERDAALAWLKAPDLIVRLLADFATCGLVGEDTNKLVGYLAVVSRKLTRPLGIVIQSSSAAGKSSLMDAVLAFVPDEDKVKYSAMTGQSLFYMGETNLKHKALAIVEEEGASKASYALKLLQSEGELTIASTAKDAQTGNLTTQQYRVEGPVALFVTTTARDIDEELLNRCLVLAVDEGRAQTRAIHQAQRDRRTLDGLHANRARQDLIALHQNAQRLLRPLAVLNPYAQYLTFPDQTTRLRRDHEKYLTLIDVIAFLHQHQRAIKNDRGIEYVEVTLDDIALANRIAHDVLGRSLDELPPQTRRLLKLIDGHVAAECQRQHLKRADVRFTRRALREAIHWGDTQLKVHLGRLAELEYLVAHRNRANGFEYELVYAPQEVPLGDDGVADDDQLRFPGLIDLAALACAYDAARSGQNIARSAPGRGLVGPQSGGGRGSEIPAKPAPMRVDEESSDAALNLPVYKGNGKSSSSPKGTSSGAYPYAPTIPLVAAV